MLIRNGSLANMVPLFHTSGAFSPCVPDSHLPACFAGFGRLAAIPRGHNHPYAILMAGKAGQIATWRRMAGAGGMSLTATGGKNMAVVMAGAGDMSAAGGLIVSMAVTMAGSGSMAAALKGAANMEAIMAGAGDMSASMTGLGSMAVTMAGEGDLSAAPKGVARMEVSMTASGSMLTTANVGNAVLDALNGVEDDWTLRQALRIILSALGGKVSISGSTVTFRDVNDTTDRIVATTDTDGQRTAVALDAE